MTKVLGRRTRGRGQRDEALSAYLDGQLNAEERARLEARLAADPALRAELEALRHAVMLLHELPPVPLPRNFILPQTAGARPRPASASRPRLAWAAPLLTAATAAVSLLFVVVLGGRLLFSGAARMGSAPAPEAQLRLEAEAPQEAMEPSVVGEAVEAVEAEKAIPLATEPAVAVEAAEEASVAEAPPADAVEAEGYVAATAEEPLSAGATVAGTTEVEALVEAVPSPDGAADEVDEIDEGGEIKAGGEVGEDGDTPTPAPTAALALKEQAPAPEVTGAPARAEEVAEAPTASPIPTPAPAPSTEERLTGAESTPSEVAEAPRVEERVEEEEDRAVGPAGAERGALDTQLARPPGFPWQALEVALGLAVLVLAVAAVWSWRARRH